MIVQVLRPTRTSSASRELPSVSGSQHSSPAQARRTSTGESAGASSSRASPTRPQQPVVVPFQGAWPECSSPQRSAQAAEAPLKAWQEPGTPSAPGMSASTSRFYHEPDQAPGSQVGQQAGQGSGQVNPLGDSVASLTQSRDAGFAGNRRVRSPSRGQRPVQPAHHSIPSTVQEEQPGSAFASNAQAFTPRAASSGSGTEGRNVEMLGRRSSSGNPFKTIRAAPSPAGRRPSLGNPFAPPEEDADRDTNPFKNTALRDLYTPART